ncbi:hypothetical protein, partial [Streptomyces goshikiensis]
GRAHHRALLTVQELAEVPGGVVPAQLALVLLSEFSLRNRRGRRVGLTRPYSFSRVPGSRPSFLRGSAARNNKMPLKIR